MGETVLFTLTARNQGQDNIEAGNFRVTDTLPVGAATVANPTFEVLCDGGRPGEDELCGQ